MKIRVKRQNAFPANSHPNLTTSVNVIHFVLNEIEPFTEETKQIENDDLISKVTLHLRGGHKIHIDINKINNLTPGVKIMHVQHSLRTV